MKNILNTIIKQQKDTLTYPYERVFNYADGLISSVTKDIELVIPYYLPLKSGSYSTNLIYNLVDFVKSGSVIKGQNDNTLLLSNVNGECLVNYCRIGDYNSYQSLQSSKTRVESCTVNVQELLSCFYRLKRFINLRSKTSQLFWTANYFFAHDGSNALYLPFELPVSFNRNVDYGFVIPNYALDTLTSFLFNLDVKDVEISFDVESFQFIKFFDHAVCMTIKTKKLVENYVTMSNEAWNFCDKAFDAYIPELLVHLKGILADVSIRKKAKEWIKIDGDMLTHSNKPGEVRLSFHLTNYPAQIYRSIFFKEIRYQNKIGFLPHTSGQAAAVILKGNDGSISYIATIINL
jgi:hypothetical protein